MKHKRWSCAQEGRLPGAVVQPLVANEAHVGGGGGAVWAILGSSWAVLSEFASQLTLSWTILGDVGLHLEPPGQETLLRQTDYTNHIKNVMQRSTNAYLKNSTDR